MQFEEAGNRDLESNTQTFLLKANEEEICFVVYDNNTAIGADEKGKRDNRERGSNFLRKGFSDAIENADESVIIPMYIDMEGKSVEGLSKDRALNMIYENKLSIAGFKFNPEATEEQKKKAFRNVMGSFVNASNNLDYFDNKSTRSLFCIQDNFGVSHEVIYSSEGKENIGLRQVEDKLDMFGDKIAERNDVKSVVEGVSISEISGGINKEHKTSEGKSSKYVFFELRISQLGSDGYRTSDDFVDRCGSPDDENLPIGNDGWMDKYLDDIMSLPRKYREGLRYMEKTTDVRMNKNLDLHIVKQTTDVLVGHGEGNFKFTSEEAVSCSAGGLCTIINLAKKQGKSVRLEGRMGYVFCHSLVCECAKANVEICNMPESLLKYYTQTKEECELIKAIESGDNKAMELSDLRCRWNFFDPLSFSSVYLDFDRFTKGEPEDVSDKNSKSLLQNGGESTNNDGVILGSSKPKQSMSDRLKALTGRCVRKFAKSRPSTNVSAQVNVRRGNDGN